METKLNINAIPDGSIGKDKFTEEVKTQINNSILPDNLKTINGESIVGEGNIAIENVQSDWNETDEESLSYIQNKPKIHFDTENYTPTITSEGMSLNDKVRFSYMSTSGTVSFGFENGSIFWECFKKIDGIPVNYRSFILSNGDGTSFLSNDGTYKNIDLSNYATKEELNNKQDILTSGTNIKTINGNSILGEGNIIIESGSSNSSAYPEINHGTSDTTFTLTPNTFHVWDEVTSLDLSFGEETEGIANEFLFQFTSGTTATTLILPDTIKWANEEVPTIETNMIYQISILKGLASVLGFMVDTSTDTGTVPSPPEPPADI